MEIVSRIFNVVLAIILGCGGVIGLFYLATALLFIILTQRDREKLVEENV